MAFQIANPEVIRKVEALSRLTGLSKTAAVEKAVDSLLGAHKQPSNQGLSIRKALLQIDQIPDRQDASNPVEYDHFGLPR